MRTVSSSWMFGLCFAVVACSGASEDASTGEAPAGNAPASDAPSAPAAAPPVAEGTAPASTTPDDEIPDPAVTLPDEGDAGAPAADAGADASAPVKQIPLPTFGKLHATESTGATCKFSVDGYYKSTGTVLDIALVTGAHAVTCVRPDGKSASEPFTIVQGQTTNVVVDFPVVVGTGTLVAVAVGGTCSFYVNGASKGTTETLKLSLAAGTYNVTCKPTTGAAAKSRSVIIKPGETAMAMFKLS